MAPKSLLGEVYPDIVKVYLKTISPIKNIANPLISVIKTLEKKRGGMSWSITWSSKVASNLSLQVSSLSKFYENSRVLRILVAQVFLLAHSSWAIAA